ncbi:MAG: DMT family transporter [Magnetovibrio sp.]|nr:DMT family transporter [Magnetovibrio sp.]
MIKFRVLGNASPAVMGAIWMMLAACLLGVLSLLARKISADLHPFEVAFFRNFAQFVLMLPWLAVMGLNIMRTKRVWAHIRRSSFGILGMMSLFWVLPKMPIAEVTAIAFSAPLFTTLGAALFLREPVGQRRWFATMSGFIGVLIIIRPGFQEVGQVQLVAVMAAVLIAGAMLSNKSLSKTENPNAMVLWMGFFMSLFSLPSALAVWQWPTGETWGWLLLLGIVATTAHVVLNQAYSMGDVSYIAPYGFVQIPFVAVLGYMLYGETPDMWTWVGASIIIGAGIYTAHREAKHKRALNSGVLQQV